MAGNHYIILCLLDVLAIYLHTTITWKPEIIIETVSLWKYYDSKYWQLLSYFSDLLFGWSMVKVRPLPLRHPHSPDFIQLLAPLRILQQCWPPMPGRVPCRLWASKLPVPIQHHNLLYSFQANMLCSTFVPLTKKWYNGVHGGYKYGECNADRDGVLDFAVANDFDTDNTFFHKRSDNAKIW